MISPSAPSSTSYRGCFLADYAHDPRGALSWRFLREAAGLGVLGDLMSHVSDLAQFLVGPIARVTAQAETLIPMRPKVEVGSGTHFSVVEGGELGPVENEDAVTGLVEFASGVRGSLEATRVLVGRPGPALGMGFGDLKVIEARLFLESVLDGRQREPGAWEMLQAAKVIDAMARSVDSGRWEDVRDPENRR